MKRTSLLIILYFLSTAASFAQNDVSYTYQGTDENPYGSANPDAPEQIKDFEALIGTCDCQSVARGTDQTWGDTVSMIWRFKYIMNGFGVMDETLKEDGQHSGSIRQFDADSARWNIHYFSNSASPIPLPTWSGGKNEQGDLVFYRSMNAPNGTPGFYRLTFYNISALGFDWVGEWVNIDASIVYPTWKISCVKT